MAHHPSHMRNLAAATDTQTAMDSTHKKHPISTTSTIQNISHRFSKLYANHKTHVARTLKPPNNHSHPEPDTDLQAKTISFFPVSNTSCPTLTKSKSHHEPNITTKEKPSSKKDPKKLSFQEYDVDKLMSKSFEGEKVKEFQQGEHKSSVPPIVSRGRRKSFCSSQVELADFFSCTGVKVVAVDMPPLMQIHAVNCARNTHDSLEKFTSKTLASTLKKEFDGAYGPAWHCIVGTSFGSFVTHSVGGFMYFSMDHKIYVLLFKTSVQRAE